MFWDQNSKEKQVASIHWEREANIIILLLAIGFFHQVSKNNVQTEWSSKWLKREWPSFGYIVKF
jgi:hypothetical protein